MITAGTADHGFDLEKQFGVCVGPEEFIWENTLWPPSFEKVYPIPMLILHGQYDDYIPMSDIQLLRDLNDRSKLVIIPGASHQFLEPGAWDMVLDLTRDWFEFEQVLLSETF